MLSNIALQLKKLKKRTNVVIHMGRTLEGPFCSHFSVGRMEILPKRKSPLEQSCCDCREDSGLLH